MSNGEESPRLTFMMLPHDLVLNCLARVSKEYYPSLSLVSKKIRYILTSIEFQELRSFLGCSGICLYVCLQNRYNNTPIWFTLRQRLNNTHKKFLFQVSSPNFPFEYETSTVAAVDSNIYAIGGSINDNALSSVMVMDCRSHTWSEAPSMHVARKVPSTSVLNGKIYVIGGCNNLDSSNWIEVFDTKTQTWEFLQIPSEKICSGGSEYKSIGYEETVYVSSKGKQETYKLHKGKWRAAPLAIAGYYLSSCCVIKNVLYYYSAGTIRWYDSNASIWRGLKGMSWYFINPCSEAVKLVDYGGNIALFWEEDIIFNNQLKTLIWCAEIAIESKRQGEIWGKLKWYDVVFTSYKINRILDVVATSV